MPQVPNFIPGIGAQLATSRYDFQKHLDGYIGYRHPADDVDVSVPFVVNGVTCNTVEKALIAIDGYYYNPGNPPPIATAATFGTIKLTYDLGGTADVPTVIGLYGTRVSNIAPTLNEILTYNGSRWAPTGSIIVTDIQDTSLSIGVVHSDSSGNFTSSAISSSDLPAASGDISGTYPALTVAKVQGVTVTATGANTGDFMSYNGSAWAPYTASSNLPTPQQIAQLRWYDANQNGIKLSLDSNDDVRAICFDGQYLWVACNGTDHNIYKIDSKNPGLPITPFGTVEVYNGAANVCFDGYYPWIITLDGHAIRLNPITAYGTGAGACSVGTDPSGMCFDGSYIWVTNSSDGTVTKIDAHTIVVTATYTVGSSPYGICYDGNNIWVVNGGDNTVCAIDPSSGAAVYTITVGSLPFGCCYDGTYIWVVNTGGATVSRIIASTGVKHGTFGGLGTTPTKACFDGNAIWVTNSGGHEVTKLNKISGAVIGDFNTAYYPNGICFDGANIWVTNNNTGTSNTISKL